MVDQCVSLVRGKTIRATQVDECGLPVTVGGWPKNVVSTGFVSIQYSPEVDDGEEINQPNANGDECVLVVPCPKIKWINVTAVFCKVDPMLYTMLTGWPVVLDEDGNATGFRGQKRITCETGTALESWTGVKAARRCDPASPLVKYGYFLVPFLTAAYVSDFTIENGVANFTIIGKGLENDGWDVGPYDILRGEAGLLPLADPMGVDDLYHFEVTTLAPPNEICGLYPEPFHFSIAEDLLEVTLTYTEVQGSGPVHANVVDWGDGTTSAGPIITGGPGVVHTYTAAGTYLICSTDSVTGSVECQLITVVAA